MKATNRFACLWQTAGFVATLLLAALLRMWRLNQNGYGNLYYAAAVRSMLQNGRNFYFASFDPAGFVSVDKPPVALWLQTASAKLFGYHGLSLLLPQAFAGVTACWLLYLLVRRPAGPVAGLISALALAVTPINVATDRSNNMDSVLLLVLLASTWWVLQSLRDGRLGSLLIGAFLLGVGFNVKMMAAFVVLPTFAVLYWISAQLDWKQRLMHLSAATALLLVVSLSWAVAVDLTPKSQRPYMGSSSNNSALGLIIDYNGIGRLTGGQGPGGNGGPPFRSGSFPTMRSDAMPGVGGFPGLPAGGFAPMPGGGFPPMPPGGMMPRRGFPMMPGGGPMGPGGMMFGGNPGPLRLAQSGMADQIAWLFPLAVVGMCAALTRWRRQFPLSERGQQFVLWSGWLGSYGLVYSLARGIVHPYYLVTLGPALAALAGLTVPLLWEEMRRENWRGYLLPVGLVVTALWEAHIVGAYPVQSHLLKPLLLGGTLLGIVILILAGLPVFHRAMWQKVSLGALAVSLGALLSGPITWALTCVLSRGNSGIPMAGPQLQSQNGDGPLGGLMSGEPHISEKLLEFLHGHRHGERYLLMAGDLQTAAGIIIKTGEPAVAMGGFIGSDPILTPERLSTLVKERQVRFVLVGGPAMMMGRNAAVMQWVRDHGKPVPGALWRASPPADSFPMPPGNIPSAFLRGLPPMGGPMGMTELYDCAPDIANVATTQP